MKAWVRITKHQVDLEGAEVEDVLQVRDNNVNHDKTTSSSSSSHTSHLPCLSVGSTLMGSSRSARSNKVSHRDRVDLALEGEAGTEGLVVERGVEVVVVEVVGVEDRAKVKVSFPTSHQSPKNEDRALLTWSRARRSL